MFILHELLCEGRVVVDTDGRKFLLGEASKEEFSRASNLKAPLPKGSCSF